MNVLYDVAALGLVYGNSGKTTGIPRVVQTLAYELAETPDCHLSLCSGEHLLSSLDYVRSDTRLKTYDFSYNKNGASLRRKQRDNQLAVDKATGPLRLIARANRKLLHFITQANKTSSEAFDLNSLRNADIYHSTYLALSEQVRSTKGPQLFLTMYDLIPILHPEFCDAVHNEWFQTILQSITPNTWLLSISEATKVDLCHHLEIDPSRIFVTPLAADRDLFHPIAEAEELARVRRKYHINAAPYVLSLCTIEPRKNIDHVIRCFIKLMQDGKTPDLQLVLAGSKGWDYDHIFKEIDGAEAFKNNIVVTGFIQDEDLAALYSGALVFVYPSLYEGFGLPPLEAMQCGVPVITSNTSSLPEVVGEAGIMLDPADVDGLCQGMLSLYENGDLRTQMSAKSLARASQFSWKRCAEETVNAYRTSLS